MILPALLPDTLMNEGDLEESRLQFQLAHDDERLIAWAHRFGPWLMDTASALIGEVESLEASLDEIGDNKDELDTLEQEAEELRAEVKELEKDVDRLEQELAKAAA